MCTQKSCKIGQASCKNCASKGPFTYTSARIGKIGARFVQEFDARLARFVQVFFYLGCSYTDLYFLYVKDSRKHLY